MNKATRTGTSGRFLLEILLSVLIFSIASAVSLQLFAYANNTSVKSKQLTEAVSLTSSAADIFLTSESKEKFVESIETYFPECTVNCDTLQIERDELLMSISIDTCDPAVLSIDVKNTKNETVYSLNVKHHFPLEVSADE